jgi:hypothetical protein
MSSESDRTQDSRRDPLAGIARAENADETNDELPLAEASASERAGASSTRDPNDEIPVPIAMWPSEIDERAQVVESLREDRGIEPPAVRADESSEEPRDGSA